jgi:hypothetical protein
MKSIIVKNIAVNLNTILADFQEERRWLKDLELRLKRPYSVDRSGLESLVDPFWKSWMPWDLVKDGGSGYLAREGTSWVKTLEEVDALVERYARMGGFLRKINESEHLTKVFQELVSSKGQDSRDTYIDMWKVLSKWGSPEAFVRHLFKVRQRADGLLESMGVSVSWYGLCRSCQKNAKVGKAAVFAAAETLGTRRYDICYREARNFLVEVKSGNYDDVNPDMYTRIQVHKVSRILKVDPNLCEDIDITAAQRIAADRSVLLRQWKYLRPEDVQERHHAFVALCKIWACFGKRDAIRALNWVRSGQCNLHGLGINLPWEPVPQKAKDWFLNKNPATYMVSGMLIKSWDLLIGWGWKPYETGNLGMGYKLLKSQKYQGVRNLDFACEAARWGLSQYSFESLQTRWMSGLKLYESIPAPGGSKGLTLDGIKLVKLAHDDPRAVFAGKHTGSCQHPDGEGAQCAWHAHESGVGAIWVWMRDDRIVAQSWVWRNDGVMILDNIDGMIRNDDKEVVRQLMMEGANACIGKLGITSVYLGTGYSSIRLCQQVAIRQVDAPVNYSDSLSVWRLA